MNKKYKYLIGVIVALVVLAGGYKVYHHFHYQAIRNAKIAAKKEAEYRKYHPVNYDGYVKNYTKLYAKADPNSKVLTCISAYVLSGTGKNYAKHSNAGIPVRIISKKNKMFKVKFSQYTGYIKAGRFHTMKNFTDDSGVSHYTRYDLSLLEKNQTNAAYAVPSFVGMNIKDIPSAQSTSLVQTARDNDGKLIENPTTHQTGLYSGSQMDVWDSWPIQNPDGTVATYHGYRIVLALAANMNPWQSGHVGVGLGQAKIYVFYQKISDYNKGVESWKNAGLLTNTKLEGAKSTDKYLKMLTQQWSGSAVKLDNSNNFRLFYTNYTGGKLYGGTSNNAQYLSTAQFTLKFDKNGVSVDHSKTTDNKSVFSSEGKSYQSFDQFTNEWPDSKGFDDTSLRDPHYIEDHGKKYLVFEANTGTKTGYQGIDNLFNMAYFGGSKSFQKAEQNKLFDNDVQNAVIDSTNNLKSQVSAYQKALKAVNDQIKETSSEDTIQLAQLNQQVTNLTQAITNITTSQSYMKKTGEGIKAQYMNAAIGIVELNKDYTVKKILKPLVAFNTTDDETERPDIIKHDGKYYMFTITRASRMASNTLDSRGVYLLGFVSDSLTGKYKPLNGSGVVLYSHELNINSRTWTYSYYIMPTKTSAKDNQFLVTSYMTVPGIASQTGGHATFAPTFKIKIKGDKTEVVPNSTLSQGQVAVTK